ncbi:hypothetical protein [Pontibacter cellulosilyticus]|uniref:Uncharacterized protein n=1 Tax=Pontibacter cellulosilyticus TaxID=1720253 RepID=A0A923N6R4_9BACT|nr:hypothetical protein [Pontibacter cellulosilyticus]MBC5993261.1 hypothetical protein [Pontibacter cellulosilyticus]
MKNKDNFRTEKHHAESLGNEQKRKKIDKDPAPKEADRESINTPKENEVYVDLEPDELHVGDEPVQEIKEEEEKKKKK